MTLTATVPGEAFEMVLAVQTALGTFAGVVDLIANISAASQYYRRSPSDIPIPSAASLTISTPQVSAHIVSEVPP